MMSPMQIIGNLVFSLGWRVIIDQTAAEYITFGLAPSGSLKSQAKWTICRCAVTNSSKLNDFEWANGQGLKKADCIWNNAGGDTYNGSYTFQAD